VSTQFYEAILPPVGPYCVVGINDKAVKQTFHNTIEEVIERGDELNRSNINAYFALASFNEPTTRSAENAAYLRAFFLDLDCGENKPYAVQADAYDALKKFCIDADIPLPVVVSSGRGLHAYWPLNDAIAADEWRRLAKRFKKLCLNNGLEIDTAVPADAARVLRMPDTHNFKSTPPLAVKLFGAVRSFDLSDIEPQLPEPEIDLSEAKQFGMDDFTRQHAQVDFPPTSFARLVRRSLKGTGCAQIAHAVKEAAALPEPLWRAALSIAWRCVDAEESVHTLSKPHPEYTPEDTIAKAEKTLGPMTCEWYRLNNPSGCEGCAHKITSPIQLGIKIEEAPVTDDTYVVEAVPEPTNTETNNTPVTVAIPTYPAPYFRPTTGGVFKRTKDEDGDPHETEIYPYDLYLTDRFYDYDDSGTGDGEMVGINIHSPHDGVRRIIVPVYVLLVKEKLRDALLKQGVAVVNKKVDDIMAYFAASFKKLQQRGAANRTRNQMGWTKDLDGFVVGELEYTASGATLAPSSTAVREVSSLLTSRGTLESWKNIVNFYSQSGMEAHALAVFAGFGAPLLKLVGGVEIRGAAINLMSNKSGTGKTTVQMVVNSIFGHPNGLLMRKNDTTFAKMQWLGMLNTIAATMDEVTNMSDEALSELVYDIPQGRGRHRMESQSNRLRVNTASWSTFLIMSSNSSLYDKLIRLKNTADGELRRLIELRVLRPLNIPKATTDAVFSELQHNYGLAGPIFIQYVMNNMESVRKLISDTQKRLDADLDLDQSDRFYSHVLSCIIAGGMIANTLGLHSIPIAPVYRYAVEQIATIRREILLPASDFGAVTDDVLSTFINQNLTNALVINVNKINGIPPAALQTPRMELRMRFEPDTGELWVPGNVLREFLTERQVDFRQAIKEWNERGMMKHGGLATSKRIGAGAILGFEAGVTRSYCFIAEELGVTTSNFTSQLRDDAGEATQPDRTPAGPDTVPEPVRGEVLDSLGGDEHR